MPTPEAIVEELKSLGRESYKKALLKHGVREPCFGVKIADLKKIQKRIKKDYRLALNLYDTGIYDAMYLAGLIADEAEMTRNDLQRWVKRACAPLAGSIVPAVAASSRHGRDLALEWIESANELAAIAGWATLGSLISVKPDSELDLEELKRLLVRVRKTIHASPNAVRYQMNGFVIAVGCHVAPLTEFALDAGETIGAVNVDMGQTACQVPFAPDYIRKVQLRGTVGRKRKTAMC